MCSIFLKLSCKEALNIGSHKKNHIVMGGDVNAKEWDPIEVCAFSGHEW